MRLVSLSSECSRLKNQDKIRGPALTWQNAPSPLLPQYPDFPISEQIAKMPPRAGIYAMFFMEKSLEFNTLALTTNRAGIPRKGMP
ncbi:MAG TPA: hypothetical protein VKH81_06925 [Candidatus Angelobacter sp.]|nr:hypothetical protein [Candidatus Angelobacter sp.]